MHFFQKLYIKQKLTIIIMGISSVALLMACAALIVYDQATFRQFMKRNLNSFGEIIANHTTAALIFDNEKDAGETLATLLRADKNIDFASIYDKDDRVFAKYKRKAANTLSLPLVPKENGCYFYKNHLILFKPILLENEKIGKLYIQSNLGKIQSRLKRFALMIVFVLCMSFLASYLLTSKFQRIISQPILHLANVARDVSIKKDYTIRAEKTSQDELGFLTERFNEMLMQIQASLREKEVLLKEIHHRVKNNLQVISSLLYLQSRKAHDQQTIEMFNESQNRIRSMALIHEKLYQSQDIGKIDFADYIRSLTNYLSSSYGLKSRATNITVNISNVFLSIDKAIPCGLIINELVSNSLKYAFPEGRNGKIDIQLVPDKNNHVALIVDDNGVGFPKDLDFRKTKTLGLQLVNTLTKQLKATIELHNKKGTRFEITFARKEQ